MWTLAKDIMLTIGSLLMGLFGLSLDLLLEEQAKVDSPE